MLTWLRRHGVCLLPLAVITLSLFTAGTSPNMAYAQADPRSFPETGYRIADDAIWMFFDQHGGVATFGRPISREFTLSGRPVQLFEWAAVQVEPDGSAATLALPGAGLLPFAHFNGLTVPPSDPALAFVAPTPDQQQYAGRALEFVRATVPQTWAGQPVQFFTIVTNAGPDVWGLPTSAPAADPRNANFVYQRFENGVLRYDASSNTTTPLELGVYLKTVLTGNNLSPDLAAEANGSVLLGQYDPTKPLSLSRSEQLPATDLTDAFTPEL